MYVNEKSGCDQTRCHDDHITNLPFRPVSIDWMTHLNYKKHPIADYCPYILRTLPKTDRRLICRVH